MLIYIMRLLLGLYQKFGFKIYDKKILPWIGGKKDSIIWNFVYIERNYHYHGLMIKFYYDCFQPDNCMVYRQWV